MDTPLTLADGSPALTPESLLARLEHLGLAAETHHHAAVMTVEEAQEAKGELPGAHTKNLFLRDKKGSMWLVVALHDRDVDLLALGKTLGTSGRLSFGSADRMERFLGVRPGSVTPYGLINDHGGAVRVALDTGLRSQETWNAHPLTNTMTTAIPTEDMLRFLEAVDHRPVWVDLEAMTVL
jgi:Ala-tRNA(Pro) deacylase